jgi:hypothetical protein
LNQHPADLHFRWNLSPVTARSDADRPFVAGARLAPEAGAFWPATRAALSTCWPVFALAGLYLAAALVLAVSLPGSQAIAPFAYLDLWVRAAIPFGFLYLCWKVLPGVIRERPDRPLLALGRGLKPYLSPLAVLGACLIATQALSLGIFTSVKNMLPDISAYAWDRPFADLDAFLAGGVDPWRYLEPIVSQPWALHMVEVTYLTGWMLLVGLVPAIIAFAPRFVPIRLQFFLTYILSWILIGNVLAVMGMSAGPAFFGNVTGDPVRFQPLLDYLAANSGSEYSAYDLQNGLWRAYENGQMSLGSGVSAFPSMHVAMAVLWVTVACYAGPVFVAAAVAFLLFVLTASVALGWHYAIDGYASIVLMPLVWFAVGKAIGILGGSTAQTPRASA